MHRNYLQRNPLGFTDLSPSNMIRKCGWMPLISRQPIHLSNLLQGAMDPSKLLKYYPLWCISWHSLTNGNKGTSTMCSMPHYLCHTKKLINMELTMKNHPQMSLKGKKNTKWRKFWHHEKQGGANSCNIFYNGKAMWKLRTLRKMLQMYMCQTWSNNSTNKTPQQ